jgi:hypothetical protein
MLRGKPGYPPDKLSLKIGSILPVIPTLIIVFPYMIDIKLSLQRLNNGINISFRHLNHPLWGVYLSQSRQPETST